ncbi:hypothetical protein COCNU_08G000700 [Cocos nucifera]|uniref:Uncharacterized protein n=1 Tax=Cocos nucifera TaxID=13894 RepID=A0A8K0IGP1_COCNU|nr:hypothetical protein COCNU_08G000700 [Cocos nucifera]
MGISSSISARRTMADRGDSGGVSAVGGVATGPSEAAVAEEAQTMGISSSVSARRAMAKPMASGAISKGDGGDGVSVAGGAVVGLSEAAIAKAQTMGISSSISARRAMTELTASRAVSRGDRGDGVSTVEGMAVGPSEAAIAEEAIWDLASGNGDLVFDLGKKSNGEANGSNDALLDHDGGADGGWRRWRAANGGGEAVDKSLNGLDFFFL